MPAAAGMRTRAPGTARRPSSTRGGFRLGAPPIRGQTGNRRGRCRQDTEPDGGPNGSDRRDPRATETGRAGQRQPLARNDGQVVQAQGRADRPQQRRRARRPPPPQIRPPQGGDPGWPAPRKQPPRQARGEQRARQPPAPPNLPPQGEVPRLPAPRAEPPRPGGPGGDRANASGRAARAPSSADRREQKPRASEGAGGPGTAKVPDRVTVENGTVDQRRRETGSGGRAAKAPNHSAHPNPRRLGARVRRPRNPQPQGRKPSRPAPRALQSRPRRRRAEPPGEQELERDERSRNPQPQGERPSQPAPRAQPPRQRPQGRQRHRSRRPRHPRELASTQGRRRRRAASRGARRATRTDASRGVPRREPGPTPGSTANRALRQSPEGCQGAQEPPRCAGEATQQRWPGARRWLPERWRGGGPRKRRGG